MFYTYKCLHSSIYLYIYCDYRKFILFSRGQFIELISDIVFFFNDYDLYLNNNYSTFWWIVMSVDFQINNILHTYVCKGFFRGYVNWVATYMLYQRHTAGT